MSKLFAMSFPILPGKTQNWEKFMNEIKTDWAEDYAESRRKLNVRERTFIQRTPHGDFVIVTLEGNNPEAAFKQFANGTDEFTKWFIKNVSDIHGMDLSSPPPQGAMPELVVDSGELTRVASH